MRAIGHVALSTVDLELVYELALLVLDFLIIVFVIVYTVERLTFEEFFNHPYLSQKLLAASQR